MLARKKGDYLEYNILDVKLHNWLLEQKKLGYTISDRQLRTKTDEFANDFGGPSTSTARENWLKNFKKRHENFLKSLNIPESFQNFVQESEEADLHKPEVEQFIQEFNERLKQENIIRDNIYTMVNLKGGWKSSLENTKNDNIQKLKDDYLTFMFCINATGSHKLSPYCIYKYMHREALECLNNKSTLVFKLQENKIMNQIEMFEDWHNYFIKSVTEHRKKTNLSGKVILLLKYNLKFAFLRETVKIAGFEILYFPNNAFGILQPIDSELMKNIRNEIKRAFKYFSKSLDIGNYIKTICESWTYLTPADNEDSWEKIFRSDCHTKEDNVTEEDTAVEEISEPLDLSIKDKRDKRLKQQENTVSAEITGCIENAEYIEENIEKKDNLTTDSHKLQKLIIKNDDIRSDKISEVLTSYAKAEAEGHQEQEEDIESIAENTCKRKFSGDL